MIPLYHDSIKEFWVGLYPGVGQSRAQCQRSPQSAVVIARLDSGGME